MTDYTFTKLKLVAMQTKFDGLRLAKRHGYITTPAAYRMRAVTRFDIRLDHKNGAIAIEPNNTTGSMRLSHNKPTEAHHNPRASFPSSRLDRLMPMGRYYYKGKQGRSYVFVHESKFDWTKDVPKDDE